MRQKIIEAIGKKNGKNLKQVQLGYIRKIRSGEEIIKFFIGWSLGKTSFMEMKTRI